VLKHKDERMSEPEQIAEFTATIPQIQSAVNFSGDGSTGPKLEIPTSEIAEMVKLAAFGREKLLRVTVSAEPLD
jgi:hypothetical protein